MNYEKVGFWIQISTGLAVIVGLALVVWELQQVKVLTRAQLTSDHFMIASQSASSLIGENAMEAITKSCTSPENLTVHDLHILDAIYLENLMRIQRIKVLNERDGLYEDDFWKYPGVVSLSFSNIMESDVGRIWFIYQEPFWNGIDREILEVGMEFLEGLPPAWCGDRQYRDNVAELYFSEKVRANFYNPDNEITDEVAQRILSYFRKKESGN